MTQTHTQTQAPAEWCAALQAKMMAALDAAWALAERSDDPAVLAKAREKARLCGQMAAAARKIATLVPTPKAKAGAAAPEPFTEVQIEAAARAAFAEGMARREQDASGKPPAAQAVAMRAALRKLGRR